MPKVSVLIPTFKYARFLPEAIESVMAQDFKDFELIISDDASNDGSAEIIQGYVRRDPRVRAHIQERNLGMVANWNWCLSQASGLYVKFLFGDDRLNSPQALGRMALMLDLNPQATLAASARLILDEDSNAIEIWDELGNEGRQKGIGVIARCLCRDRNLIGEPSAVLFRREACSRGFDTTFRQLVDEEMWFHLLASGDLVYDPEPLCAFRRHPAQQTVVNSQTSVASVETLLLLGRYLDQLTRAGQIRPNSLAVRRLLFQNIYYSRKNSRRDGIRSPEVERAERWLMDRLTPRWYALCFLLHRATKPVANLARRLNPPVSGRRVLPKPLGA